MRILIIHIIHSGKLYIICIKFTGLCTFCKCIRMCVRTHTYTHIYTHLHPLTLTNTHKHTNTHVVYKNVHDCKINNYIQHFNNMMCCMFIIS